METYDENIEELTPEEIAERLFTHEPKEKFSYGITCDDCINDGVYKNDQIRSGRISCIALVPDAFYYKIDPCSHHDDRTQLVNILPMFKSGCTGQFSHTKKCRYGSQTKGQH